MVDLELDIPIDFLNEEEIFGYTVSKSMKEVWAVELDLLNRLDQICRKYGIQYFASGGTLLGAVRHHGFIPWDDDIDVAMTRANYEKLCEVAPLELEEPYFFQTEYTDPGSARGHAQLRNSSTTGILKLDYERGYSFNQGIFIDIFPFDNVLDDEARFNEHIKEISRLKSKCYYWLTWTNYRKERGFQNSIKVKIKNALTGVFSGLFYRIARRSYKQFEDECKRFDNESTQRMSMLSFRPFDRRFDIYPEDYQNIVYVDFEFIKIPIPAVYDRSLTIQYGDYMTPVNAASYHSEVLFDTSKSYKEYLKR